MKLVSKYFEGRSLRFQFIFWTCFSFAITSVISFGLTILLFLSTVTANVEKESVVIAERIAASTSQYIWQFDMPGLEKLIILEAESSMIDAVNVKMLTENMPIHQMYGGINTVTKSLSARKNEKDIIIFSINASDDDFKQYNQKLKRTELVSLNDNVLAKVDVYFTPKGMYDVLFKAGLIFFINVIIMFMCIVFIMLYLLNNVFLSRLRTLISALSTIVASDRIIPAKLEIEEVNEFGDVRIKINEVQDKFRTVITSSLKNEKAATVALEELKAAQRNLIQSEKMAALGGVVAGVAHELNTPLGNTLVAISTIQAFSDEFKEDYDKGNLTKSKLVAFLSRLTEGLNLSFDSSQRAASLVEKFKQVAVDQTSDRIRTFKVLTIVHESLAILNSVLKKSKAKIVLDVDPSVEICNYPGSMYQIFSNLIANAVIHGLDGSPGHVIITVRREDHFIKMEVADDGKGISPENMSKIFDPFFTTTFGKGGSGLGLHIALNEAAKMKGELTVKSTLGEGTTFTLTFDLDNQATMPAPL